MTSLRGACEPITAQAIHDVTSAILNSSEVTSDDGRHLQMTDAPAQRTRNEAKPYALTLDESHPDKIASPPAETSEAEVAMVDAATQTDAVSSEELAEMTMRQQLEVFACDVIGDQPPSE